MKTAGLVLLALLAASCGPTPYQLTLTPPKDSLNPPSAALKSFTVNEGLSLALDRTSAYCGQVTQAIANETDARQRALNARRVFFASATSACAAGAGFYNSFATVPDKRITTALSACATGLVLTSIPALGNDDQIPLLQAKAATILSHEQAVATDRGVMEAALRNLGILRAAPAPDNAAIVKQLQDLAPIEDRLRGSLATLANSCQ